jgi:hypothetical protein
MHGTNITPEFSKILLGGAEVSGPQVLGGLGKLRTYRKTTGREGARQMLGNSSNEIR